MTNITTVKISLILTNITTVKISLILTNFTAVKISLILNNISFWLVFQTFGNDKKNCKCMLRTIKQPFPKSAVKQNKSMPGKWTNSKNQVNKYKLNCLTYMID